MMLPPLLLPLASSGMAPSTNCLSVPSPPRRLQLRMSLTSLSIVAHLRPHSLTKTRSRTQIVGTRRPPAARNLPRSWPNGFGTSDWNWDNSSLKLNCAPPSLLPPAKAKFPRPTNLNQWKPPRRRSSLAHRNGRASLLRTAFPVPRLLRRKTGTLRCPANHPLYLQERRPERDGSLRVLYAARIGHCRSCPLRAQCQESSTTLKPRRVSAVLWPLSSSLSDASPPPAAARAPLPAVPVLWRDWPRCGIRRTWLKVIHTQTMRWAETAASSVHPPTMSPPEAILTRAQRAHWRLSWEQRLARNARPSTVPRLIVTLHGLPAAFASSFGFGLLATA